MANDSYLLCVRRYGVAGTDAVSQRAVSRANSAGRSVAEVLERYRGMEGVPAIPTGVRSNLNGVAPWSEAEGALQVLDDEGYRLDMVRVDRVETDDSGALSSGPDLLGYDVGLFEGAHNIYSVVFHEVLFGKEERLKDFSGRLNEALLLSTVGDARDLLACRDACKAFADLETFDPSDSPGIFAIRRVLGG